MPEMLDFMKKEFKVKDFLEHLIAEAKNLGQVQGYDQPGSAENIQYEQFCSGLTDIAQAWEGLGLGRVKALGSLAMNKKQRLQVIQFLKGVASGKSSAEAEKTEILKILPELKGVLTLLTLLRSPTVNKQFLTLLNTFIVGLSNHWDNLDQGGMTSPIVRGVFALVDTVVQKRLKKDKKVYQSMQNHFEILKKHQQTILKLTTAKEVKEYVEQHLRVLIDNQDDKLTTTEKKKYSEFCDSLTALSEETLLEQKPLPLKEIDALFVLVNADLEQMIALNKPEANSNAYLTKKLQAASSYLVKKIAKPQSAENKVRADISEAISTQKEPELKPSVASVVAEEDEDFEGYTRIEQSEEEVEEGKQKKSKHTGLYRSNTDGKLYYIKKSNDFQADDIAERLSSSLLGLAIGELAVPYRTVPSKKDPKIIYLASEVSPEFETLKKKSADLNIFRDRLLGADLRTPENKKAVYKMLSTTQKKEVAKILAGCLWLNNNDCQIANILVDGKGNAGSTTKVFDFGWALVNVCDEDAQVKLFESISPVNRDWVGTHPPYSLFRPKKAVPTNHFNDYPDIVNSKDFVDALEEVLANITSEKIEQNVNNLVSQVIKEYEALGKKEALTLFAQHIGVLKPNKTFEEGVTVEEIEKGIKQNLRQALQKRADAMAFIKCMMQIKLELMQEAPNSSKLAMYFKAFEGVIFDKFSDSTVAVKNVIPPFDPGFGKLLDQARKIMSKSNHQEMLPFCDLLSNELKQNHQTLEWQEYKQKCVFEARIESIVNKPPGNTLLENYIVLTECENALKNKPHIKAGYLSKALDAFIQLKAKEIKAFKKAIVDAEVHLLQEKANPDAIDSLQIKDIEQVEAFAVLVPLEEQQALKDQIASIKKQKSEYDNKVQKDLKKVADKLASLYEIISKKHSPHISGLQIYARKNDIEFLQKTIHEISLATMTVSDKITILYGAILTLEDKMQSTKSTVGMGNFKKLLKNTHFDLEETIAPKKLSDLDKDGSMQKFTEYLGNNAKAFQPFDLTSKLLPPTPHTILSGFSNFLNRTKAKKGKASSDIPSPSSSSSKGPPTAVP